MSPSRPMTASPARRSGRSASSLGSQVRLPHPLPQPDPPEDHRPLWSQIHGLGANVVVSRLEGAPCDDVHSRRSAGPPDPGTSRCDQEERCPARSPRADPGRCLGQLLPWPRNRTPRSDAHAASARRRRFPRGADATHPGSARHGPPLKGIATYPRSTGSVPLSTTIPLVRTLQIIHGGALVALALWHQLPEPLKWPMPAATIHCAESKSRSHGWWSRVRRGGRGLVRRRARPPVA